jgi:N-sulfoglucosamine sulfohydrolase
MEGGRLLRRGWAASLALFGLACGAPPPATDPDLPNVVLIVADDLGWRDLSSYGNPDLRTPHIDRLAAEGLRFTRAFVAASSCSPSRASLLTGQYPHTNGVTGLAHLHPGAHLSPFHETLADLLSAAGYRTGIAGKWHIAPFLPTGWYGYDERMGGLVDMRLRDPAPLLDFLRRHRDQRFYLEINFMDTHRDDAGDFDFDPAFPVDPDGLRVPDYLNLPDWPEIRLELAKYYSQAMSMDAKVGAVLATLDELGLAENTLVLFSSDNGPPFPGSKMTLYDRGIATPLIARWPARLPAGGVRHALVSTVDVLPTILEAIGRPVPDRVQGRSFLPLLAAGAADRHRDAVFAEMTHHVDDLPTRAVRTGRWKYIRNYSDAAVGLDQLASAEWAQRLCELPDQPWKRPRVPEELYDLAVDPNEQRNLVGDPAARSVLEALRRRLDAHMAETADPFLGAPFTRDPDPRRDEPGRG